MDKTYYVDDITYSDLELDKIYGLINHTKSSAGADMLMKRLRNPYICKCDEFKSFYDLTEELALESNLYITKKLSGRLSDIGELKKYPYNESLDKIRESEKTGNLRHIFFILFVVLSFALIFVTPGFGLVLFFVAIGFSVTDYFKCKNLLSDKLAVFSYIIRMLKSTGKLETVSSPDGALKKSLCELSELRILFKPFVSFSFFIQPGVSTSGNIVSVILDYVRIIFHADIIKYNSMLGFLSGHTDEAKRLYEIIGDLDAALSIDMFKTEMTGIKGFKLCKPNFVDAPACFFLKNAYHPLISNPVTNSIETTSNVLLTGSNASGKSTYLKTVAVNAIFAQSFFFAFADEYDAGFMRIFTSMALRDSLINNESYFMAEIKSLKRIFDAKDDNCKILCIIDEVLRGTNTVERISASVEILKAFCSDKFLCFAATHDIELTELLSDDFENYSFSETYTGDDITFDYKLKHKKADSKNAIKLLELLGFDKSIVDGATRRVEKYLKTGSFL